MITLKFMGLQSVHSKQLASSVTFEANFQIAKGIGGTSSSLFGNYNPTTTKGG
jgi:hypothetical protein